MNISKKTSIKYSIIGMTFVLGIGTQYLCVFIIYLSSQTNWIIATNLFLEGWLEIYIVLLLTAPLSIISLIWFFKTLFKMDDIENGK